MCQIVYACKRQYASLCSICTWTVEVRREDWLDKLRCSLLYCPKGFSIVWQWARSMQGQIEMNAMWKALMISLVPSLQLAIKFLGSWREMRMKAYLFPSWKQVSCGRTPKVQHESKCCKHEETGFSVQKEHHNSKQDGGKKTELLKRRQALLELRNVLLRAKAIFMKIFFHKDNKLNYQAANKENKY